MSPTYCTAFTIRRVAAEQGWQLGPVDNLTGAWSLSKGRYKATICERSDGGICWMYLRYPMYGGMNADYYGPRSRDKLATVLKFLGDCENWRR